MYGAKNYFKNSKEWTLVKEIKDPTADILRRAIFKHQTKDVWVVMDAYQGREIKQAIEDFLDYSASNHASTIKVKDVSLSIGGGASMVAYVEHNGLMDFDLNKYPTSGTSYKSVAILACYSKSYFKPIFDKIKTKEIVWTNGKMAPEAYVLEAIISSWMNGGNASSQRVAAGNAYALFQKISTKAGLGLFSYKE